MLEANPTAAHAADERGGLAAIVPARNEAANIRICVESLMAQKYPSERMRILVVDDHSTDDTAGIVRRMLAQSAKDTPQLLLIASPPLPPGWIGKSHACWIGAQRVAQTAHADDEVGWLCFLDADVEAEPALMSSAMQAAVAQQVDLLSLAPRQRLGSFAERLILPCGLFLLAFRQDLRRKQAPGRGDEVTVTGQFMLMRRSAYEAVGGHSAIRDVICEDLELARVMKRNGFKVTLLGGERLISARMYSGWKTLWPGLAKNLVDTFGGPFATMTTALVAVVLAWSALLIPAAAIYYCVRGQATNATCVAAGLAVTASLAAFAFHVCGARYFRIPYGYGLLFPLGYTIGAVISLDSLRRRLSGRVTWKDRCYPT